MLKKKCEKLMKEEKFKKEDKNSSKWEGNEKDKVE